MESVPSPLSRVKVAIESVGPEYKRVVTLAMSLCSVVPNVEGSPRHALKMVSVLKRFNDAIILLQE